MPAGLSETIQQRWSEYELWRNLQMEIYKKTQVYKKLQIVCVPLVTAEF